MVGWYMAPVVWMDILSNGEDNRKPQYIKIFRDF
jgi:hypothetical protein